MFRFIWSEGPSYCVYNLLCGFGEIYVCSFNSSRDSKTNDQSKKTYKLSGSCHQTGNQIEGRNELVMHQTLIREKKIENIKRNFIEQSVRKCKLKLKEYKKRGRTITSIFTLHSAANIISYSNWYNSNVKLTIAMQYIYWEETQNILDLILIQVSVKKMLVQECRLKIFWVPT